MNKRRLLFVINPISGTGHPIDWESLINETIDSTLFDYEISYTNAKNDAIKISSEAAQNKTDIVCAVGGDGTINEVAQGLLNTNTALAIVPRGSGNGLARHFSIPIDPSKALKTLNTGTKHLMDIGQFNDNKFLCVSGVGFDAEVAHAFDQFGKRGFWSYAWLAFKAYISYKPRTYEIEMNGDKFKTKALLIAFANASQFGNNTYIAPSASTIDGLLNLVIIKPFPFWATLNVIIKVFTKKIYQSKYCEHHTFESLKLQSDDSVAHLDGEPIISKHSINVSIIPKALKIVF